MSLNHNTLVDRLPPRLEHPLPGHEAHLTMAPRYPARQQALSVEDQDCLEAGVLILLYPKNSAPAVVLTVRHEELPNHAGQISFPGGQREAGESLPQTALREAEEEIDLDSKSVRVLGALTPLYIPPSNFCVHPFVGAVPHEPFLSPTDREVDEVLHVPLAHLLNPATRTSAPWILHDQEIEVPYFKLEQHHIWGATAMILAEFLEVVRDVLPASLDFPS